MLPLKSCLLPILFPFSFFLFLSTAFAGNYQVVTFETKDGAQIEAAFFEAKKNQAVVFTHGAVFNKESWYPLAEKLKERGVSSLTIDFRGYGNSKPGKSGRLYYDVLGAVNYLEQRGFEQIALVGGSMGGSAILHALNHEVNPKINRIILLAPATGEPVKSKTINKLFIVTKGDRFYSTVYDLFAASAEPKELKVYPGASHAQHIFKDESGPGVEILIIDFLCGQGNY